MRRRALIIEIIVLAMVLVIALVTCALLTTPSTKADDAPATEPPKTTNEDPTTTPTEPEVTPAWVELTQGRTLTAQQYFVYDTKTDSFIETSHAQDARVYPASITKLMTALVALDYLQPTESITAGQELDKVVWGSSVAGIKFGDTLTTAQLIEAMLLPSGNDAAYIIAAAAGRKILNQPSADASTAVTAFMNTMNQRTAEYGMTDSHFANPDGIHSDDHYMSFRDLALLGELSAQNETIRKYAALAEGDNPRYDESNTAEDAPKQWKNTNALIHPESEFYCPYVVGLKTGQTPYAGSCLLSAFEYGGNTYIVGVFQCPDVDDRFGDTLQLFVENVMQ